MDRVGEEKEYKNDKASVPFFPHHVLKEGVVLFVLLGILITLSIVAPFDLGEKANPLSTPHAIKPEWYFLSMYHVLKYFPKLVGIFVVSLAPLFLVLWPFIDRSKGRHPFQRPISVTFGILVILSLLFFGTLGYISESKHAFFGKEYEFDVYGRPHLVVQEAATKP